MRLTNPQIIFSPTAAVQATFTVTAATDLVTSNAHGLSNGDLLQLTTQTTLPAGLALATDYYVINATTNTFQLAATPGGVAVDITDTGTGTQTFHLKGKAIYVGDYEAIGVHLTFGSTPTMTIKFQGSVDQDAPDFNAAQSITNLWDYIEVIDRQTSATPLTGDTGIACSGTADNRIFEINTKCLNWVTVAVTAFTQGTLGVTLVGKEE